MTAPPGGFPPGIVEVRRSTLRLVAAVARSPLAAVPPACFEARLVLSRTPGRLRAYVCDPALIQEVLVRNADALAKSDETKRVLGAALGDGLLTADGAAWRWQRQAIAPNFQHDKLVGMLPTMMAAAEAARDRLLARPPGTIVDVGHEMMHTTFAIVLETMLSGSDGVDAAAVERSVTDFLSATSWMFALAILRAPRWLPFPGRSRAATAARFMRRTIAAKIAQRRGGAADDLLGMLLAASDPESGRAMADDNVADNILTFVAAGHETTAVALGWTLALLSDHPGVVARLLAEIDAVTGGGPVQARHVADFAYAKQVVSESMRLYPPIPLIARAVRRDVVVEGVTLPAGAVAFVPIHAVHRHRDLWDRPDDFDPDRFAPEAVRGRLRYAFMPFGAGPRICVGSAFAMMEAVAILAVLVRDLRFERTGPMPRPVMRVSLRPARPLRLRVTARGS